MNLSYLDDYQGQRSMRIQTESASYILHCTGAGLASISDPDGVEWIGYKPITPGEMGKYRGFPNMVFERCNKEDSYFHPGHRDEMASTCSVVSEERDKITVHSVSQCHKWEIRWDFYESHLNLTVLRIPDAYWILYEGTPGGCDTPETVRWTHGKVSVWSARHSIENFSFDTRDSSWVAFTTENTPYALAIASRSIDSMPFEYWWMSHPEQKRGMTVAGFGREDIGSFLKATDATFSLCLTREKNHHQLQKRLFDLAT